MKTIRNYMLMMLMMVLVFTSCNQENVVPDTAAATIDGNVDVTGEDPALEDESDEDGEEAEGYEEEGEEIDPSSLPQAILDYISQNYADALIEEAELYANGDYEVELDSELELLFDSEGNFLGEGD